MTATPASKETGFAPSTYQARFFEELVAGTGDIQLVAVAGAGKTKSIEEGVKRLPASDWSQTLLCAFNSHIKAELTERQESGKIPAGVRIATLHGLGYSACLKHYQPKNSKSWVWSGKTRHLCELAWHHSGISATTPEEKESLDRAKDALVDLVRLSQLTLSSTEAQLRHLLSHYDLDMPAHWEDTAIALVPAILRWCRKGLSQPDEEGRTYHPSECISFDEMIWLPVVEEIRLWQYKWLFVDECQDLNACQLELIKRLSRRDARRVFVGDKNQAIYGFTGASADMFDRIQVETGAARLPLSICYRCASFVVRVAKVLVPQIEAGPTSPVGRVASTDEATLLGMAAHAWRSDPNGEPFLLLCRTNAPLLSAAFALIRQGIPAWIKGRDIGLTLIWVLEEANRLDRLSLRSGVEKWKSKHLADVAPEDESAVQSIHDKAAACHVLLDFTPGGRLPEIKARIQEIFSEEGRGVVLSSVHKSKGLEAQRVGILRPETMPMPFARQAWQMDQEMNLIYVAVTRAQRELWVAGSFGGMLYSREGTRIDFSVSDSLRRLNHFLTTKDRSFDSPSTQEASPSLFA
jgi:superfamily I DNA/RNA helicase